MTQEPRLDIAAFTHVDPLDAAKESINAGGTRGVRSNRSSRQGKTILWRKRHKEPAFILSHNLDVEGLQLASAANKENQSICCSTLNDRKATALTRGKIMVFAPMPRASVMPAEPSVHPALALRDYF
jgi:hypothetical protein